MNNTIKIKSSGIPFVDKNWGGFYTGSTYLINGQPKSGKTSTALQYAYNIASGGEVCVFFTNVRPRKLIVNAYSQGLNIQPLIDDNKLIILRMVPPKIERIQREHDEYLSEFLYDIIKVADEYKPSGIVFDELTQYMGFADKEMFRDVFNEVVETLEDNLITSVFVMKEATSSDEVYFAKQLEDIVNGVINLYKQSNKHNPNETNSTISIVPHAGHPQGQFVDDHLIRSNNQIGNRSDNRDNFSQDECYEQAGATNELFDYKRADNYYETDQALKSSIGL